MYLKSVEMQGFKSFADKIYLDFNPGITAIVGPNGSGKSNISDAIRWVMGEQSIKSLRGSKMEDVIFAGTVERKPLGFAEVSLTLDNSTKLFPLDYEEITVSRRVYRSGESEYSINKSACRLKDIHELFMDTGLGREGYSIIGQGKIDEILSNKSEDRRHIFEEAAGITKYKYRKAEAEKKLSQTTENLTRICDILSELEGQLEPLKQQSEKAKKYLNFREELKSIDLKLSVIKIKKGKEELSVTEKNYNELLFDIEVIENNIKLAEKQINDIYEEISAVEALTEEYRNTEKESIASVNDYTNRINILLTNVEHEKENIKRIESDIEKSVGSGKYLDDVLLEYGERIKKLTAEKEIAYAELEAKKQQQAEYEKELELSEKQYEELTEETDGKRLAIIGAEEKISSSESLLSSYELRKKNIASELEAKKSDYTSIEAKFDLLSEEKNKRFDDISRLKEELEKNNELCRKNETDLKMLSERKQKISSIITQKSSKRAVLEDMEAGLEGYGKSVKAVMNAYNNGEISGTRLHGPLSQLIHTDKEYVTAIDIALQNSGQNIVTDNEEDAKRAIKYLKDKKAGRATFLPISTVKPRKTDVSALKAERGFIALASELVKCKEIYGDIVSSVLGAVVVADNIDNAVLIAGKSGYKLMVVTLQGDLIRPGGAMTGGSIAKSSGFLSRLSEIDGLKSQEEELRSELAAVDGDYKKIAEEIAEAYEKNALLSEKISVLNEEYIKIVSDYENQKAFYESLKSGKENLENELKSIEEDIKNTKEIIDGSNKLINEARSFLSEAEVRSAEAGEKIQKLKEVIEGLRSEMMEFNISYNNLLKDIEFNIEHKNDISAQIENVENVNEERKNEIKAHQKRIEDINFQLDAFEEAKEKLNKNSETANIKVTEYVEKRKQLDEEVRKKQETEKAAREQLFSVTQHKNKLESKKSRIESELNDIFDRLWEDYETTYSEAETYLSDGEAVNSAEAEKKIASLKASIKNLGNINIDAIEGYKSVKERFDFLTVQTNDLKKSRAELEGIISELLTVMQKQFKEQFYIINKNFNAVFKELFGGGTARLGLSEPENLLESGIEIEAQPPGKKLQSLTLLSGGERAFTAIALLFAILKVRPTPFCILDEIEAALDDVNVYRFADYLKNYSDKTQFIVVTHRRGTMEAANVLYGVTMQERGVSKLLSLNIDEVVE